MTFIIDANNLCGKLGLLNKNDFDKKLIKIITEYNQGNGNEIILVFDGADIMGDKYSEGNITVIKTPRDSFYKSADDKIIELAKQYVGTETIIVTDDIAIKKKIKEIINSKGKNLKLEQATDFAKRINNFFTKKETRKSIALDGVSGLSKDEVNEINRDLLKSWK